MTQPRLTRIEPDQQDQINALILQSKSHWGYDAPMMEQMARVLRLDMDAAAQGRAIAGWLEGAPIGTAQVTAPYEDARGRAMELELLFIAPKAIGTGLGRRLYLWALDQARDSEADRLDILSDPFARGFYTAMGASFIEDRPSKLIPGRSLPWLEHRLS
ncbi:GNAT family N-acetyltransferase [Maricaulaceae bacterium EIL42A08]|nr:GNAT family N-acetyltransferase [Maricaulaceae bacterium EIL42A08]